MLSAEQGYGIKEDCHADAFSPRQVLLASAETYQRLHLPSASLRENVTVSSPVSAWRSGSTVAIGPQVVLRVTFACEPCGRLNAHRPGLSKAVGAERGMLARVIRGGTIRAGDTVAVQMASRTWWPERWQDRVRMVLQHVPVGAVVDFRQLALLAGVPVSYCRTFPRLLASEVPQVRDRAVSATTNTELPRWMGFGLFADALRLEDA